MLRASRTERVREAERVSFELFVSRVGFACVVIVVALVVYLVVARTLPLLRMLRDEKGPQSFQKKK